MEAVLVTGANRGIGLEFVRQYARDGARVFACCRAPAAAEELKRIAARADAAVSVHALDIAARDSIEALKADLRGAPIDILVNNAGAGGDLHQFDPPDDEAWLEMFRANALGAYRVARALKANLKKGKERKIVCMSSGRASHARHKGDGLAYCATKAALNSIMYGLSVQWKDEGFIVAMFAPGRVKTDLNPDGSLTPEFAIGAMRKAIAGLTPPDTGRYLDNQGRDVPW